MVHIQVLTPDDWRLWRELRLSALAESPLAFGAKLADWQGEYDSEPRWRARLSDVPFNIIAKLATQPIGMASGTRPTGGRVELISMWVAPEARGMGVGDRLIHAITAWASNNAAGRVELRVYQRCRHALALYARNGFEQSGSVGHRSARAPVEWHMTRRLER